MKRIIFSITALLLFSQTEMAMAQLTGETSGPVHWTRCTPSGGYVGTGVPSWRGIASTSSLVAECNLSKVGIGTMNPQHSLDVKGKAKAFNIIAGASNLAPQNGLINSYAHENHYEVLLQAGRYSTPGGGAVIPRNILEVNSYGRVGVNGTPDKASLSIFHNNRDKWSSSGWKSSILMPRGGAMIMREAATNGKYIGVGMTQSGWYFLSSSNPAGQTSTPAKYAMHVDLNGKMYVRELEVTMSGWPDYVFKDDYDLKPLSEVSEFIEENGHLPGVPSQKEIVENGLNVGDMTSVLMEKIEELTLHVIDLQNQLETLQTKSAIKSK